MSATRQPSDRWLAFAAVAITAFGVLMVYSSSAIWAGSRLGSPFHYLVRQGIWAVVGLLLMALLSRLDANRLGRIARKVLGGDRAHRVLSSHRLWLWLWRLHAFGFRL